MATFVTLCNFTEQGIRNFKDSPARYEAFKAMAEQLEIKVKSFHYTTGAYDCIVILEGTEENVTAAMLKLGSLGNVRTQTLHTISVEEMKKIIGKVQRLTKVPVPA